MYVYLIVSSFVTCNIFTAWTNDYTLWVKDFAYFTSSIRVINMFCRSLFFDTWSM